MSTSTTRTAIEELRSMVGRLDFEPEWLLDPLPSLDALRDYLALWDAYDTEFRAGIEEAIHEGADPTQYNDFIRNYQLPWPVA